jgi:outer membrane protein assembly factor BamA
MLPAMRPIHYLIFAVVLMGPYSAIAATQAGVDARGVVESAEITGVDQNDLSQDIRDSIHKLVGQKFDQQTADELVVRVQAELPDFIVTTRLLSGSQPDRVKVLFTLEKSNEQPGSESNVNSRYTVERVEVQGFDESKLSQSIRDEMKKLIGEKLDQDKANEIQRRLDIELRPKHHAVKKVVKGSDRQHIVVVYEILNVRWIPFIDTPTQRVVFHSKQNFSAVIGGNVIGHDNDNNRLYFGLANDQDLLIERFAGFNVGFESTKVGSDRLGVALRYSRYHDRWQPSTVAAGQTQIYRERNNFAPTITFAFDPRLSLTAGVNLSDLQIQYPAIHRVNANAATAALNFHNIWGNSSTDKHWLDIDYDLRAGNHNLDSDFIYTRHFARAQYVYGHTRDRLFVSFLAGSIAGNAPLFERFSLGNSSTLRGWNKFDVAPLGGNRVVHATLQYGFGGPKILDFDLDVNKGKRIGDVHLGFHLFYDTGAVGDAGAPMKARHSAGFGFGQADSSSFFFEIGFPIRSGAIRPALMMGFRF